MVVSGQLCYLKQRFIVAKTDSDALTMDNLTKQERKVIKHIRWLSMDEIENSNELIYPLCLKNYLPQILAGNYPKEPIELDLGENP